jgi:predicted tellurium resistance membrane protein TerC
MPLAAALVAEPHSAWEWVLAIFNIVWIDIVLAGDNAVVIALAVRNLPTKQRLMGIVLGAGAAVVLRVGLTFVATQLMTINFVQLAGGLLILWIAIKLLKQKRGAGDRGRERSERALAGGLDDFGGGYHDVARQRARRGRGGARALRAPALRAGAEHPTRRFCQ